MTLRIVSRVVNDEKVVELHGWLSGPEVAEFEGVCASWTPPFSIALQQLAGASAEGILALKELRARGAELIGASPYIDLLLRDSTGDAQRRDGNEPRGLAKPRNRTPA